MNTRPPQPQPALRRLSAWLMALIVAAVGAATAAAQTAPTVTPNYPSYPPNHAITIAFANGPGNAKDWVGVYKEGETPGPTPSTIWYYVDGTETGSTGLTSGKVTFPGGLPEGNWVTYLLLDDGYTTLATNTFTVSASAPTLTLDKSSYATNETITVTFTNGPGGAKDWIGVYKAGETPGPTPSTIWNYVDGTQNGSTGLSSGKITFTGGLGAVGDYVVYFLVDDGYQIIADASFTVKVSAPPEPAKPSLISNYSYYFPEEDITFTFKNGPGNARDWIGFYPDGVTPGSVGSTRWYYVNGSQASSVGLTEGTVNFAGGLTLGGDWNAYLLLNDGYDILATNVLHIVDFFTPLVRPNKRVYTKGETISVTFTNGPGGAKDWIGIYKAGQTPGGPASTSYLYVDGTQGGAAALTDGTVVFTGGLTDTGDYVIYFLVNDSYDIIASETISVIEPVGEAPRIVFATPSDGSSNLPPVLEFSASITNGATKLATNSITLKLDGTTVTPNVTVIGEGAVVTYSSTNLPAARSQHSWAFSFKDTVGASISRDINFTIGQYTNIVLPTPLYFENFDNVPEGELPQGWTQVSYTDVQNPDFDLGNLDSASYATWTVVAAERFQGSFVTYSNPDNPQSWADDYHRVLTINPFTVLNGQVVKTPLASGRFLFADSGYRNGAGQVLYAFSPDYNLTGKKDVHLSFHSIYEQNQDSIGAVEYSIDKGQTWLPVVYYINGPDVLTATNEVTGEVSVDAVATFTQDYGDVAHYADPNTGEDVGGHYGAFIGAEISQDLAPYISMRVDDNASESKRIELFRLPQADNQATVRFRFAYAGTDSWYFGVDDFGLYSITAGGGTPPKLSIATSGNNELTITWPADAAGYTLESAASLTAPAWSAVTGVANNSVKVSVAAGARFYRLKK